MADSSLFLEIPYLRMPPGEEFLSWPLSISGIVAGSTDLRAPAEKDKTWELPFDSRRNPHAIFSGNAPFSRLRDP
jgi:hypothetical protein